MLCIFLSSYIIIKMTNKKVSLHTKYQLIVA